MVLDTAAKASITSTDPIETNRSAVYFCAISGGYLFGDAGNWALIQLLNIFVVIIVMMEYNNLVEDKNI